jgi:hypothetical protein
MALPPVAALAIFMGLVLVLALYALTVSGHFPAEYRDPSLRTGIGRAVLWATLAIACLLALAAIAVAWRSLPFYATVIAAGAMLLLAPLLLRPMPDSFVNGRRGLIVLAAIGTVLALLASHVIA